MVSHQIRLPFKRLKFKSAINTNPKRVCKVLSESHTCIYMYILTRVHVCVQCILERERERYKDFKREKDYIVVNHTCILQHGKREDSHKLDCNVS